MGGRFRLHRRVDGDPLQRTRLGRSRFEGEVDARQQHLLQTLEPNPLAPPRHGAGIDRRRVLEELEATKDLPVRVLHPAIHHLLVRQIVDVLQVMQTHHQPGRLRRPSDRPVEAAEGLVEARPGHEPGQSHQGMARADDRLKALAEQIILAAGRAGRAHRKTPENDGVRIGFRQFPILQPGWESL